MYKYLHKQKIIKNAQIIKAWVEFKLFIVLGLMK